MLWLLIEAENGSDGASGNEPELPRMHVSCLPLLLSVWSLLFDGSDLLASCCNRLEAE